MTPAPLPPPPRRYGLVNWIGLRTLIGREVRRFLKVGTQTVAAPAVTTLLLLAVFALALGGAVRSVAGVPFAEFLAPGLIMMAMVQNAFANTSSSLVIAKVQGNIVDSLMPPLNAAELTLGFALGGVIRGLVVGGSVAIFLLPFVRLHVHAPGFIVFHALAASLMLSFLGLIGGIWSQKFDHIAAFTNFVVTPLAFLSGTFYTIDRLPEPWHMIALMNPFFYMIDGFRYGFIGHTDGGLALGVSIMLSADLVLGAICYRLFQTGWRLRA
ncbi:MAG: ABC transporter permease [Alphaproteobacteria bacterium]|nr:ABC transporter permease [Alphaproteobacteria bacterium]